MKLNKLNMEVLTLTSHLVITVILILAYVIALVMGHSDITLQSMVLMAGGFWFGLTAKSGRKQDTKTDKKEDSGDEQ